MRILILTMTCGQGHNAIAETLKASFPKTDTVEIFDSFGIDEKTALREHKGYLWCIKNIPHIYEFFWNVIRKKNPKNRYSLVNTSYISKVYDYNLNKINSFKPDAIICTHNYNSNLCCKLKKDKQIDTKIYSVLFDYVACPFWETSVLCDAIFTPSKITHSEMIERGFKRKQLVCTGFPVSPEFEKTLNRNKERHKHNFTNNDFVVLSMAGGFSQGNSLKLVKELEKMTQYNGQNIKAFIFCSKNVKKKEQIDKYISEHDITHIKTLGFIPTNEVSSLMTAADVIFTRGGCNSLNETLNKGIVPIIREDVYINEKINKELFLKKNIAYGLKNIKETDEILKYILDNPKDLDLKRKNGEKFASKSASKHIVKYIKYQNKI